MKRTNLMIDKDLLEEAQKVLKASTYSAAVNEALQEVIRIHKINQLGDFFGSGVWEGDLPEMREDSGKKRKKSK